MMYKILWEFQIQTDHIIQNRRPDLMLINKQKRTYHQGEIAVSAELRRKLKERDMIDKYVVYSIDFQTFFVQAFKIVTGSWKFTMLLLYVLWDDWPIFIISASNQQLQQQLEFTLLKPDYHSWWISKLQFGHEDTLKERYAIKFCFKLRKNATEMFGMLQTAFQPFFINRASVFEWHKRFKELTPCEFWLFPKLRGCRYETIEEMKEAVTKVTDTLTQEDFHGVFQKLLEWYNKCIAAGGNYFKED